MTRVQIVIDNDVVEATCDAGRWKSEDDDVRKLLNGVFGPESANFQGRYVPSIEALVVREVLETFAGSIILEEDDYAPAVDRIF